VKVSVLARAAIHAPAFNMVRNLPVMYEYSINIKMARQSKIKLSDWRAV